MDSKTRSESDLVPGKLAHEKETTPDSPTHNPGLGFLSPTKRPLVNLNRILHRPAQLSHKARPKIGDIDALEDERDQKELAKAYRDYEREQEKEQERENAKAKRREDAERMWAREDPLIRWRYGTKVVDDERDHHEHDGLRPLDIDELHDMDASDGAGPLLGKTVSLTARIHHTRAMSSKLAFVLLRQQEDVLQGVLEYDEGKVSENFVRWAEALRPEGLVHVTGKIRRAVETVKSCTVHNFELVIETLHVLTFVDEALPIDVFKMDRVEEKAESQVEMTASGQVRLQNRIVFLRTPTMQSVFRLQAVLSRVFRSSLEDQGFIEIHTPKIQPAATESGAEVFPIRYFGRTAYLAQSPQLAKQMAISADFGRVFEIGPVFRAEHSNTHRHLTEFTGLDLEMAIGKDYHEAVDIIDGMLKRVFAAVYHDHRKEVDIIRTRFPSTDLVWLEKTPILKFADAVDLLNSSGWRDEDGNAASPFEDLSTRAEIRLGQLVKEKYGTDYYIVDKFPASARPFYTKPDADDDRFTNSFDIFVRGQEICTGGERINDPAWLLSRMRQAGIDRNEMAEYMEAFTSGAPHHAGCGIGLERLLFLMLNLGDIRNASMFPRDPKSFTTHRPSSSQTRPSLPYPEADTIRYSILRAQWEERHPQAKVTEPAPTKKEHRIPLLHRRHKEKTPPPSSSASTVSTQEESAKSSTESDPPPPLPTVEDLIANYGDATNTSWLDERYTVWRDVTTGAAVGYAQESGYALIMGDPLCDPRQFPTVIRAFLRYLKTARTPSAEGGDEGHAGGPLRPLWLLASKEVTELLVSRLDWRALTCVAEERVEFADAPGSPAAAGRATEPSSVPPSRSSSVRETIASATRGKERGSSPAATAASWAAAMLSRNGNVPTQEGHREQLRERLTRSASPSPRRPGTELPTATHAKDTAAVSPADTGKHVGGAPRIHHDHAGSSESWSKLAKKERRAEKAGVKIHHHGTLGLPPGQQAQPLPESLVRRSNARIDDWLAARRATGRVQVHMTSVQPWKDEQHRHYLWAERPVVIGGGENEDKGATETKEVKEWEVVGLVVLARLSPRHGWQIKYALDFPGAPSGTIEALLVASLKALQKAGVKTVTFGAGASRELKVVSLGGRSGSGGGSSSSDSGGNSHAGNGHKGDASFGEAAAGETTPGGLHLQGIEGVTARLLARTYAAIAARLRLGQKSEFREKFGARGEPVYICYPPLGLGVAGVRTLVRFFEDEL